ncbi:serine hydrolase domain-containing protein [Halopiger djelfimassiliensis]|uniref:serine hydrolase domain-containing protein n=1 Tax=Halopiger djelfimassiliensis TaxID=1293047 RepID=UPI00067762A1|nr:serine hydrolase domain-containing protein [Halopiger djelfimassiliensis]
MSKQLPRRRVLAGSAALGLATLAGRLPRTAAEPHARPDATNDTAAFSSTAGSPPDATPDLDDLESFVDERLGTLLDEHDVAGASVAVVSGDAVELTKGYGVADVDDGTAVDAERTRFRIGSISKPLVWTAVMQLLEDGRIDPHEDVRTSLESVSPPPGDEPITVAHLATHTAGFEERFRGTWVTDPDDVRPLDRVLEEELPERVRPPGRIASYSNYGAALAAQIVADVTGTTFENALARRLFEPLGMADTTFEQPVPDDAAVSNGYTATAGPRRDAPDLFLEIAPAGAATATAADMARFMRAHLGGGIVDGERVLAPETVERMHEQWFTHHDAIPGIAFGLLEDERRGVRVLEHDGAIPGSFYSYLLLVPEYDLGLFVSYNTDSGALANGEFVDAFVEEFVPRPETEPSVPEPDGRPDRVAALEGTYRGVRIAKSTRARLPTALQAGEVDVGVDGDGYLVTDFGGGPTRWVQREPLVFDAVDGEDRLAFGATDGEITHLFLGFHAFERIAPHESLSVHRNLAAASALGTLSGAVGWPLGWAKRRVVGGRDETDSSDAPTADEPAGPGLSIESSPETGTEPSSANSTAGRGGLTAVLSPARARWIAGGAIACVFGFVIGTIALLDDQPYTLFSDPPLAFELVSTLPLLGTLGATAAVAAVAVAWYEGYWGILSRIHYTLVVASIVVFCWLLAYWNFL